MRVTAHSSQPRQRPVVARLADGSSPRVHQSARSACRVAERSIRASSRAASCQPSGSLIHCCRRHHRCCHRQRPHFVPADTRTGCSVAHRSPRATSRAAMDHIGLLLQHSQYVYAIPVGIVLVCAILVFVFGFKKAEQPPFAQLSASDVDRKLGKKRGKIREKKAANGQVASEKTSPAKKTLAAKAEAPKKATKGDDVDGKLKEHKQEDNKIVTTKKEKEHLSTKAGKENKVEQVKNKKNLKNLFQEKPVDFDDGDWEQAYSRKDKKNKKKEEESPSKKNKKAKKTDLINEAKQKEQEKPEVKDKTAKETENKELKEKEKKEVIFTSISDEEIGKAEESQKEEQSKVEKIEKEEKKSGKSKKNKKTSESESTPASVPSTPKTDNKPIVEEQQEKPANVEKVADTVEENKVENKEKTAMFDELGDVWTEAKPQKKSKKKARKDN